MEYIINIAFTRHCREMGRGKRFGGWSRSRRSFAKWTLTTRFESFTFSCLSLPRYALLLCFLSFAIRLCTSSHNTSNSRLKIGTEQGQAPSTKAGRFCTNPKVRHPFCSPMKHIRVSFRESFSDYRRGPYSEDRNGAGRAVIIR